ncbi:Retrotransposon protein, Ty3-gypsy subclass [Gossypium australe]|uniref:Retrotransposon protein, Ty3-gypsy subclass n=1 Tax=Gossypium australe TaxID=47621 RepID=A0A5B6UVY8_9ROSI|nr:Retrotransposon protein, Ty3-gypsy subclass [Gossypium australe]
MDSPSEYQTSLKMAPFEALYGQIYKDPLYWSELIKRKIVGTNLIREIENKVGDKVFLKVLPLRKVLQFSRKEKLSPRFIGPYEILKSIGLVAYRLTLPPESEKIQNIFHVLVIHRYCLGLSCVIFTDEIELQLDFVVQ